MNIYKIFFLFFAGVGFIVFSPILIIFLDTVSAFHTSSKIREQNQIVNQTRLLNYSLILETQKAMVLISEPRRTAIFSNRDGRMSERKTAKP